MDQFPIFAIVTISALVYYTMIRTRKRKLCLYKNGKCPCFDYKHENKSSI